MRLWGHGDRTVLPESSSNLTAGVGMTFVFTCDCEVTEIVQSYLKVALI